MIYKLTPEEAPRLLKKFYILIGTPSSESISPALELVKYIISSNTLPESFAADIMEELSAGFSILISEYELFDINDERPKWDVEHWLNTAIDLMKCIITILKRENTIQRPNIGGARLLVYHRVIKFSSLVMSLSSTIGRNNSEHLVDINKYVLSRMHGNAFREKTNSYMQLITLFIREIPTPILPNVLFENMDLLIPHQPNEVYHRIINQKLNELNPPIYQQFFFKYLVENFQ